MGIVKFIFGTGWWVAWHGLLLLLLPLLYVVLDWMRYVIPGGGPQGGEGAVLLLLMIIFLLMCISLVNSLFYAATLDGSWMRRYLRTPGLVLLAWIGIIALILWLFDAATEIGVPDATRRIYWFALVATFIAIYGANLWTMARVRGEV